jgi:hypothetical protein
VETLLQVQHSFELSVTEAACGGAGLPRMFISIGCAAAADSNRVLLGDAGTCSRAC